VCVCVYVCVCDREREREGVCVESGREGLVVSIGGVRKEECVYLL
jgi:hypothetical protein